jgi:hypothetical protein
MLRVTLWIAVGVVLVVGGLWLMQRRLIYLPSGTPADAPPGWENLSVTTGDRLTLAGWFHPPVADGGIVIVCNGNAGSRSDRLPLGTKLAAAGLGVVLFDYRGYGTNPGSPTEEGLASDAEAVAEWVAANHRGLPVAYFGESLGAAVAVRLAVEHPPAALVLRSPFTSLGDVAAVHYPFLPVRLLLWDDYATIDRISDVAAPLLVVAGSADSIVPTEQSQRVFDAASEPKTWLVVEGADHNDAALAAGDDLVAAVVASLS